MGAGVRSHALEESAPVERGNRALCLCGQGDGGVHGQLGKEHPGHVGVSDSFREKRSDWRGLDVLMQVHSMHVSPVGNA